MANYMINRDKFDAMLIENIKKHNTNAAIAAKCAALSDVSEKYAEAKKDTWILSGTIVSTCEKVIKSLYELMPKHEYKLTEETVSEDYHYYIDGKTYRIEYKKFNLIYEFDGHYEKMFK